MFRDRLFVFVLLIHLICLGATTSAAGKKFQIELRTPDNASEATPNPHKSIHVQYRMEDVREPWTIVGFEPILQLHFKAIEQLSVTLCDSSISTDVWYDDQTHCYGLSTGMLIYQWNPYASSSPLDLPEHHGFVLKRSMSIVFTVIYRKERYRHKEQTAMLLSIWNRTVKFPLETIVAGDPYKSIRFSCQSTDSPRLLFALQKFAQDDRPIWWRVHIIRVRQFGRKLIESVFQWSNQSKTSLAQIEFLSTDLFFVKGDYLLLECEDVPQAHCFFLIYYTYKSSSRRVDPLCPQNDFPDLFKILPSTGSSSTAKPSHFLADADGWTVFVFILSILFLLWISIIVGCVIMRRVRGLVNFRTMPSSLSPSERNKFLAGALRSAHFGYGQRGVDADHIVQADNDQGGGIF